MDDSLGWICDKLGVNPRRDYTGGERGWIGDSPFIFLATEKVKSLGWRPKVPIRDGVVRTLRYLRDNRWLLEGPRVNVAVVGCGLIGNKRFKALGAHRLTAAADSNLDRARKLAALSPGARAFADWREAVGRDDVDLVSRRHDQRRAGPGDARDAVRAGKHVLVEKPAASNAAELEPVAEAAASVGRRRQGRLQPPLPPGVAQGARRSSTPARSAR